MIHIKEYKVFENTLDYSNVEIRYEGKDMLDSCIKEVENSTGKKVVSVEGSCTDSDFDLYFDLEDGSEVTAYYAYSPYVDKSRNRGILNISYKNKNDGISIDKKDTDKDIIEALPEDRGISDILKFILGTLSPLKYVIELPREHFGTKGYTYDVDNETKSYMTIDVSFETEEEAKAWINSLIIKKPGEK
jgi:hypothetical protein